MGCARQDTTPVARGEYYSTGKPDYDEFFVKIYRLQQETAKILQTERSARDTLALALGAPPNAAPSELAPALEKLSFELDQAGVTLAVRGGNDGPPEVEVRGEPKGEQAERVEAVRKATSTLRELERLGRERTAELDALRTRSIELDQHVDRVFWTDGAAKRSEVKRNLNDARELITLMSDNHQALGRSAIELFGVLQATFKPKEPERPVVAEEQAEPDKENKKKKGRGQAQRPTPGKKTQAKGPARPAANPARTAAKRATPSPAARSDFDP